MVVWESKWSRMDKNVKFQGNLLHIFKFRISVISILTVFSTEAQQKKKVCQGSAFSTYPNSKTLETDVCSVTLPILSGHLLSDGDLIMGQWLKPDTYFNLRFGST